MCSIHGCLKLAAWRSATLCRMHKSRLSRLGTTKLPAKKLHLSTLEHRFWKKVIKNGPLPASCPERGNCWTWTGATLPWGYGKIGEQGKTPSAHRTSWEIHFGPVPDGMFVLHYCDNPPCTNPAHLFLGSNGDNRHDSVAKHRHAYGSRFPQSKLTPELVRTIRRLYSASALQRDLALLMGVTQTTISSVVTRRSWKHVL